jgi:hypothetical protein
MVNYELPSLKFFPLKCLPKIVSIDKIVALALSSIEEVYTIHYKRKISSYEPCQCNKINDHCRSKKMVGWRTTMGGLHNQATTSASFQSMSWCWIYFFQKHQRSESGANKDRNLLMFSLSSVLLHFVFGCREWILALYCSNSETNKWFFLSQEKNSTNTYAGLSLSLPEYELRHSISTLAIA